MTAEKPGRLYALSDLHMDGGTGKPMDIFGPVWADHVEHIRENWMRVIRPEDRVLIAGDISWGMYLQDVIPDLMEISSWPGEKILLRGNHDYWWSSVSRVRQVLPPGIRVIQNDALEYPDCVICGSRGWKFPGGEEELTPEDGKIYARELIRLEMSLEKARKAAGERPILAMMHYPPLSVKVQETGFTQILEKYGVQVCVYGHLHGYGIPAGWTGKLRGISYHLTSADALSFCPMEIRLRVSPENM